MGWEGGKTTCAESATLSHDAMKRSEAWAFPPSRSGTLAIILSADVSKSSRCSTVVQCGGADARVWVVQHMRSTVGRTCVGTTLHCSTDFDGSAVHGREDAEP